MEKIKKITVENELVHKHKRYVILSDGRTLKQVDSLKLLKNCKHLHDGLCKALLVKCKTNGLKNVFTDCILYEVKDE